MKVSEPAVLDLVVGTISRYNMLPRGARVGVAVSGGSDSVCLLYVLHELAPVWDWSLDVLHVDHRLRGEESDGDALFVQDLAAKLRLPYRQRVRDVATIAQAERRNLEETARLERRAFFFELIASGELDRVATGHTRSDQAETVLFRLLRGSGPTGMSGILPVTREGLIRPLLEIERETLRAFLRERSIPWRNDSSNDALTLSRNRIRAELLPNLEANWNPNLASALARHAEIVRAEEEFWHEAVAATLEPYRPAPDGSVVLPIALFREKGVALSRRLLRRAAEQVRGNLEGLEFDHVEAMRKLACDAKGNARVQPPGLDVVRSFDWIRVSRSLGHDPAPRCWEFAVSGSGRFSPPGSPAEVVLELEQWTSGTEFDSVPSDSQYNEGRLDWGRLGENAGLRNWRPGDRFQPNSGSEALHLKSLFMDARIPLWERRNWPVLAAGSQVAWARQFGVSAWARPSAETRFILKVKELAVLEDKGLSTNSGQSESKARCSAS
jgi:tRNA(Ile)-lysidine synthase